MGYYQQAIDIDTAFPGSPHPMLVVFYGNLGSAWEAKGDMEKANPYYAKAQQIQAELDAGDTEAEAEPAVI